MQIMQSKQFQIQDEQVAFFSIFWDAAFYNVQSGVYRFYKVIGTKHEFIFFMQENVFNEMTFSETEDGGIFFSNATGVSSYAFEKTLNYDGESQKAPYLAHSIFYEQRPDLVQYAELVHFMPIKNGIEFDFYNHDFIEQYALKTDFFIHHHESEGLKTYETQSYIFTDLSEATVGFGYVGGVNKQLNDHFEERVNNIAHLFHQEEAK